MQLRGFVIAALIVASIIRSGAAFAQSTSDVFRHPDGLFALVVPQGASAQPGEGPIAVRMTSVHGWAMTVQTGKATPGLDLGGMVARLEERYLGPARAWSAKQGQRSSQLGGLPGIDLAYEGERARWQVTIARGRYTDFVVFISAQPEVFTERAEEIRSVLASFDPRPEEGVSKQDTGASSSLAKSIVRPPQVEPKSTMDAAPVGLPGSKIESDPPASTKPDVGPSLTQRFLDESLGFSVDFPGDWNVEREVSHTVIFGGRPGSDAYFTTVEIQNISPPGAKDPIAAANAAFDESKKQIEAAATGLVVQGESAFEYDRGGTRLLGREFLVTYLWQEQRFSKWVIVLPNPTYPVAHVFSYTAPEANFSANRPIAAAMLERWVILGTEKDTKNR